MHQLSTAFVLGYHGCDRSVADALLEGEAFKPSKNQHDWLGHGIYFWEANPRRGLEFAEELRTRYRSRPGAIETPAVVGAVIDLGFCLDLTSSSGISAVRATYDDLRLYLEKTGADLPVNHLGNDLLLRDLDCAVINHLHKVRKESNLQRFDSVRGVFLEGSRIYADSGFFEKTHIQICVCDPACIKGVFRVPPEHLDPT
ncbi:hypothetical protein ACI7BZ_17315 [Xanthobacter sp. AM11]|uniref:hypothetical protein n=1 Tax=Xanthobacter sp. AM11 TaxID=3380643 RepID=UPI0039BED839